MRALRSRRIETTPAARTRGTMSNTRQQPSRAMVAAGAQRRRTSRSNHLEQSATHTSVNNSSITDRATEHGPSEPATVAPTGDAICITAMDAANEPPSPVAVADDPTPDAGNSQADADEDMAMDAANDPSNPVEAADDPTPDAANNQAGRPDEATVAGADEDMAMDVANDQYNPVEAADDPAADATKPNAKPKEPGLAAEEMRAKKEVRFRKSLM
jgi:hypothetical protein